MNLAPEHVCDPVTEVVDAVTDRDGRVVRWLYIQVCAVCDTAAYPAVQTSQAAA